MFEDVSPRIAPVVEDLTSENVAADSRVVVIAGTDHLIMPRHERIDILDLERGMVKAGLADAHAQKSMMIGIFFTSVTAHECRDDVVGISQIDLVRRKKAEA